MWNAAKIDIPESDKLKEHIRVLEQAVTNAQECGTTVGGKDVQKALDYFTARLNRYGGLNLFEYGMQNKRMDCLIDGLALMKKHLGP